MSWIDKFELHLRNVRLSKRLYAILLTRLFI